MFKVGVRRDKKFTIDWPGQLGVFERIGKMAGAMIRDRVVNKNVDADGRPIPGLARRDEVFLGGRTSWIAPKPGGRSIAFFKDKEWAVRDSIRIPKGTTEDEIKRACAERYGVVPGEIRVKMPSGGQSGMVRVVAQPYSKDKIREGAKPKRDGWFTGSMWKSLVTRVTRKGKGSSVIEKMPEVHVYFYGTVAKTVTTSADGKKKTKTFRQKDKAWFLQHKVKNGRPGALLFTLMELSREEQGKVRDELARILKVVRPR